MRYILSTVVVVFFFGRLTVFAEEIYISGTETIKQQHTTKITNTINTTTSTGNNSASGNTDGSVSIVTGDSTVSVKIHNETNSNSTGVQCCITPTIDIPKPSQEPSYPNQPPTTNSNSSTSKKSSDSTHSTVPAGIGGGEILGLAVTSSFDWITLASNIGGIVCLGIGSTLVTQKQENKK